jgi:hypothetical protein
LPPTAPPDPPDPPVPPDPPDPLAPLDPLGPAGPLAPPELPEPPEPPEPPGARGALVSVSPAGAPGPAGPTAPPGALELPVPLDPPDPPAVLGAGVALPVVVAGAFDDVGEVLDVPVVLDGPLPESDPHAARSGDATRTALMAASADHRRRATRSLMQLATASGTVVIDCAFLQFLKYVRFFPQADATETKYGQSNERENRVR